MNYHEKILIRNEQPSDYEAVEKMTREAFYNQYIFGCVEHFLVHVMRKHEDFIPELDFVLECDGKVIGNIMYTKARLVDETGKEKKILTFGPLTVLPKRQRRGYGKMLMEYSFWKAVELGYDTVVIFGSPSNYVSSGFQCCRRFNVSVEGGKFPAAMMVKELVSGALSGHEWTYYDSPVMAVSPKEAEKYDASLEPMEKKWKPSQEEFYILSQSFIGDSGDKKL